MPFSTRAKGKKQPVELLEVLDVLPDDARQAREQTRARFTAAVERFRAGDLAGAFDGFEAVREQDAGDGVTRMYLTRTRQLLETRVPAHWDGVVEFAD